VLSDGFLLIWCLLLATGSVLPALGRALSTSALPSDLAGGSLSKQRGVSHPGRRQRRVIKELRERQIGTENVPVFMYHYRKILIAKEVRGGLEKCVITWTENGLGYWTQIGVWLLVESLWDQLLGQYCLTSYSWLEWWNGAHHQQMCGCYQTGHSSECTGGSIPRSGGPRWAGERSWEETQEAQ